MNLLRLQLFHLTVQYWTFSAAAPFSLLQEGTPLPKLLSHSDTIFFFFNTQTSLYYPHPVRNSKHKQQSQPHAQETHVLNLYVYKKICRSFLGTSKWLKMLKQMMIWELCMSSWDETSVSMCKLTLLQTILFSQDQGYTLILWVSKGAKKSW